MTPLRSMMTIGMAIVAAGLLAPARAEARAVPPQAAPVAALIKAATTNDLDLLKSVFSERISQGIGPQGWPSVMAKYRRAFKLFGKYPASKFNYRFRGNDQAGRVTVMLNKQPLINVNVVKEGNRWKVNDR